MRWLPIVVALCACGSDRPSGACEEGETRECYNGPPGTQGVGTCAPGIESCINGKFTDICVGDVTPFVEHCDGLDEDCSGEVDDVEGSGEACTNANGCDGTTACAGASLACVGPDRNACDVCDGVTIADLGTACVIGNCSGQRVCNGTGDGTDCNAPAENACALCGGPAIVGLDANCTGAAACPGINVCNGDGDDVACDCNPQPGMCRAGTVFRAVVAPVVGDLVITELMQSPSGDDTLREWFEVLVTRDVDINQLELDRVGDSLDPDLVASVDCIRVTAGTRLVFARSLDPLENGNLPTPAGKFTFSLVPAGNAQIQITGTVLDAVTWTTATNDAAMQLDPDSTDPVSNDTETNFCEATTPYDGADLGTPGAANAQCPLVAGPSQCIENGTTIRAIVKPPAPPSATLVITEFLANPALPPTVDGTDDDDKEWFEIKNTGATSFDLNDLTFKHPGVTGTTLVSQACLPVAPGALILFARNSNAAENGSLPRVDFTFNFNLVDSGANASLSVLDGATVLDTITWTSVTSGRALGLDADHENVTDNDVAAPTAGVYCLGTATYGDGTNQGTPTLANPDC